MYIMKEKKSYYSSEPGCDKTYFDNNNLYYIIIIHGLLITNVYNNARIGLSRRFSSGGRSPRQNIKYENYG